MSTPLKPASNQPTLTYSGPKPPQQTLTVGPTGQQLVEVVELTPRTLPDDTIINKIYYLHAPHADKRIDVPAYSGIFHSIITRSDPIIENFIKGTEGRVAYAENQLIIPSTFDTPFCLLNNISAEMGCNPPGLVSADETTMRIFEKLRDYQWEEKAMLAYAAFSLDYGELWHLVHYYPFDAHAKVLGVAKGVPNLKRRLEPQRRVFDIVRSLLDITLDVIKAITELRTIQVFDQKEATEVSEIAGKTPAYAYWVIHALVAVKIQIINFITPDQEGQPLRYLEELNSKILGIRGKLEEILKVLREHQEELGIFSTLIDWIERVPTPIHLVIEKLIYGKKDKKVLIDGAARKEVYLDVLKDKYVILVISSVDISEYDLEILAKIHDKIKLGDQYRIVWLPIRPSLFASQAVDESQRRFDEVASRMPWYVVPYNASVPGYRYIEEKWQYREDPLVVVLDPLSKVVKKENPNALHLIRIWGPEAIPFTRQRAEILLENRNWISLTLLKFVDDPRVHSWIQEDRNIIFYGGKEDSWIKLFEDRVDFFKNTVMPRDPRVAFHTVQIGKSSGGAIDQRKLTDRFWNLLWAIFIVKKEFNDPHTQDILKLLFYRSGEKGWAVLTKGSTVLTVCRGTDMQEAVGKWDLWKDQLNQKPFTEALRSHIHFMTYPPKQCDTVTVPPISGWVPQSIKCPECVDSFLDAGYTFKCCHGRDDA